MKFKIYEDYLAEQQTNAEKSGQLHAKKVEAEQRHCELLTQYELTMTSSITKGKDMSAELDGISDQIDKAKRDRDRAVREYEVYNRIKTSTKITKDDIIAAWNSELNPAYYEKEIVPALEALEAAKKTYIGAMCNYFDKVAELKWFREEVSSQLGFEFPYHFHIKELNTTQEYDHYFIRDADMKKAQRRG